MTPNAFHRGDAQKAAPFWHPSCQTLDARNTGERHAANEAELRVLRQRPSGGASRCSHVFIRVHVLRGLRNDRSRWQVPELRR